MKKNSIYRIVPPYWKTTDLENLFDIRQDRLGMFYFNLNENIYFRVPESAFLTYACQYAEMHWPLISYTLYGTTRLAWFLMKVNDVRAEDMFIPKRAAEKVKYLDKSYLQQVIKTINGYK